MGKIHNSHSHALNPAPDDMHEPARNRSHRAGKIKTEMIGMEAGVGDIGTPVAIAIIQTQSQLLIHLIADPHAGFIDLITAVGTQTCISIQAVCDIDTMRKSG